MTTPEPISDNRSVLVRLQCTPAGLREVARILEQRGEGSSVRINWYTAQVEFVNCSDLKKAVIQ